MPAYFWQSLGVGENPVRPYKNSSCTHAVICYEKRGKFTLPLQTGAMHKSSLMMLASMGILAIAPTALGSESTSTQATTQTIPINVQSVPPGTGLAGSYFGVTVDANNAMGLSQEWLRYTNNPAGWYVNQALEGTQTANKKSTSSNDNTATGQGFQGRIDLANSPVSVRGKVTINPEVSVVQPIVSYDVPIARNANIYAGAGYTFVTSNNTPIPATKQNSVVLTAGAEAAVGDKVVIYGDAQYQLNNPNFNYKTPVKVQVGVGYRF